MTHWLSKPLLSKGARVCNLRANKPTRNYDSQRQPKVQSPRGVAARGANDKFHFRPERHTRVGCWRSLAPPSVGCECGLTVGPPPPPLHPSTPFVANQSGIERERANRWQGYYHNPSLESGISINFTNYTKNVEN